MAEKLFGFDVDRAWDYENGFYLTSHVTRLAKMVAHFELYKSIINLPGHIVESGGYKGASLIRFATFREILESPYSRKIIGFDAFGKFPDQDNFNDVTFIKKFEEAGGNGISVEELRKVFTYKKINDYELIKGDILQTVPLYLSEHPELKIALLHIDVDVYQPTVTVLNVCYDRIVTNGLVVIDDFATVAGATRAIDEFFAEKNVVIKKSSISHIPAYIRK